MKTKTAEQNVLIAGFGGQGVILAGNVLAYACIESGKNVLALASYGAEVRGGTAKALISISDELIDSPIMTAANLAMIMNSQSFVKYIDTVKPNSPVIANTSLIDTSSTSRYDLNIISVDATNIAIGMGNIKVANIIMLGVMIKKTGILGYENIQKGLARAFDKSKKHLYYINEQAFEKGYNLV